MSEEIIYAMCRAHDEEEAAQRGEPSPWRDGFDRDLDWENQRFFAMREAFDVAKAALSELDRPGGEVSVDDLAQVIRRVDGSNSLGAGALAEAILGALPALSRPAGDGEATLPVDVTIDHMTFKAGVKLSTLVAAATRWKHMASQAALSASPSRKDGQ
jgi:hypothetical protein